MFNKPDLSKELSGRRALVTGGTRGIGAAVARRLLDTGAKVAVAARKPDDDMPAGATFVSGDVATSEGVEAIAIQAIAALGGLDILVNNAGGARAFLEGSSTIHQAQLLPEWGDTTFFLNGTFELDQDAADELARRGVSVETTRIRQIDEHADVVLTDGRRMRFAGLFTAPRNEPSTPLAEQLGCELVGTPMGVQIGTSESKETTVPGVFACGETARVPHSLSLAVGDGAWAGAQLHRSLV